MLGRGGGLSAGGGLGSGYVDVFDRETFKVARKMRYEIK